MLIAICIIISIIVSLIKSKHNIQYELHQSDIGHNTFSNVSYKTYDAKKKEITLTSEKVFETKKDNYVLNKIKATFELPNNETGTITADTIQAIRSDKTVCNFRGNVVFSTVSGILLRTEQATIDFNKKTAKGNSPIYLSQKNLNISSDKYYIDINHNIVTLIGHVCCIFNTNSINNKTNQKSQNCYISSEKMIIYLDKTAQNSISRIEAIGNISFSSQDYNLKTKKRIIYSPKKIATESAVNIIYKNNCNISAGRITATLDTQFRIREATAHEYFTIKTKDINMKSNSGVLKNNKIIAHGNVVISHCNGNIFGDNAELDLITNSISIKNSNGVLNNGK